MTPDAKIHTAPSARANGFRYVRSDSVAVVSVVAERRDTSVSLTEVLQACVARFDLFLARWLHTLPDDRLLLFAATPLSEQHNVISQRRGVWGRDGLQWLVATARRSASSEIAAQRGVLRFVGLAEVEGALLEAADFTRAHGDSFLLLSPDRDLSQERVRALATKVFPQGASELDWGEVVALVEEGEHIAIRASGGFDDREASLDAFLSNELLRRLGES